jgi:hypothetical protein
MQLIAELNAAPLICSKQSPQAGSTLHECLLAKVLAVEMQQVNDLEIDTSSYSSILKNRLSQMRCTQCGQPHELSEVVSWLAEDYETPPPEAA